MLCAPEASSSVSSSKKCGNGSIVLASFHETANVVYVYATVGLPSVAVASFENPVDLEKVTADWAGIAKNE